MTNTGKSYANNLVYILGYKGNYEMFLSPCCRINLGQKESIG